MGLIYEDAEEKWNDFEVGQGFIQAEAITGTVEAVVGRDPPSCALGLLGALSADSRCSRLGGRLTRLSSRSIHRMYNFGI
jgi:hypothetical protein